MCVYAWLCNCNHHYSYLCHTLPTPGVLQLVEEHGTAAARLLGMEERKVSHKSTWSASCDIIRHIFDDYVRYELWSIGVMATDWVRAVHTHTHTHTHAHTRLGLSIHISSFC